MAVTERMFGKSIKRREDPRFITGRGNYVDDLKLPGMTYAAFVRSPHANARIKGIDVKTAKSHPGVVAVFTGKDMTGVNSLPCGWDLRKEKGIPGVVEDLAMVPHMPLTSDVARHVGTDQQQERGIVHPTCVLEGRPPSTTRCGCRVRSV